MENSTNSVLEPFPKDLFESILSIHGPSLLKDAKMRRKYTEHTLILMNKTHFSLRIFKEDNSYVSNIFFHGAKYLCILLICLAVP